jgi:hypothetical protein
MRTCWTPVRVCVRVAAFCASATNDCTVCCVDAVSFSLSNVWDGVNVSRSGLFAVSSSGNVSTLSAFNFEVDQRVYTLDLSIADTGAANICTAANVCTAECYDCWLTRWCRTCVSVQAQRGRAHSSRV